MLGLTDAKVRNSYVLELFSDELNSSYLQSSSCVFKIPLRRASKFKED